jgi:hypothetical protein
MLQTLHYILMGESFVLLDYAEDDIVFMISFLFADWTSDFSG